MPDIQSKSILGLGAELPVGGIGVKPLQKRGVFRGGASGGRYRGKAPTKTGGFRGRSHSSIKLMSEFLHNIDHISKSKNCKNRKIDFSLVSEFLLNEFFFGRL